VTRTTNRPAALSAAPPPAADLVAAVEALRAHYGEPSPPPTADPFELVLLENIAYLAPPAKRREAFELLKTSIGTTPDALLAATKGALERVTAKGILKGHSAEKLRECARIAVGEMDGDVAATVSGPLADAKRALRRFPSIGEPGAEKILLFSGRHALLAADSNILRVLVRLGLVAEDTTYARMYAASQRVSAALPFDVPAMQVAHLLLQQHGQTLCKRSAPRCSVCPLVRGCAYARGQRR